MTNSNMSRQTDEATNRTRFAEAPWNGTLTKIVINFDGGCEPKNPGGWMVYSWVMTDQDGVLFNEYSEIKRPTPDNTNNIAEWLALGTALKSIADAQTDVGVEIVIRGDSQLVINQLTGHWLCHKAVLQTMRQKCVGLLAGRKWSAEWVPREQNAVADELGRKKYLEVVGSTMPDRSKTKQAG